MHRIEGENVDTTSGVNLFKQTPPYTVITPEIMNALQEEIMYVISQAGLPILNKSNDTRTQLWQALSQTIQPYNYVVSSQATFNALFTRTAANTYKINTQYRSVYFKYVEGGYSVTPILSGGDTWGDLYTNNATSVEFENGAYINFGDNRGNLTVDTSGCYLRNVDIRGLGVAAAGVVNSFYLQNTFVTFDNCKTSARNSNVDFVGFQGSGTALHNITSKFINCSVYTIDGSDKLSGFKDCYNFLNCIVNDIDGTGDVVYGFNSCSNILGCFIYDISANADIYGFYSCNQVSGCTSNNISSTNGQAYGFNGQRISSCYASDITSSSAHTVFGFNCSIISSCYANNITNTNGAGAAAYGFSSCRALSSCEAGNISSTAGAAEGFHACTYGAALYTSEATNSGNDFMDTTDAAITNKFSTMATAWA